MTTLAQNQSEQIKRNEQPTPQQAAAIIRARSGMWHAHHVLCDDGAPDFDITCETRTSQEFGLIDMLELLEADEYLVVIAEGSGRSKSRTAYAISPTNQFRFLSKLVGP